MKSINFFAKCKFFTTIFALHWFLAAPSWAVISVELSGSASDSYLDTEHVTATSGTLGLSLGLGEHFMVGIGHNRSYNKKKGYQKYEDKTANAIIYYNASDDTETYTTYGDLTVILYNGVVSPFIFGGIAKKEYYVTYTNPQYVYSKHLQLPLTNRYGFGLSFLLSRSFRLKLTQTYTPGEKISLVGGEEKTEKILEKYSEIGLSYRID
jgi:hypothetical protein